MRRSRVQPLPRRDGVGSLRPESSTATPRDLEAELHEACDAGFDRVVLDLREVTFLEPTAVRAIVSQQQCARLDDVDFSIISGPPAVDRVLELCGVRDDLRFSDR